MIAGSRCASNTGVRIDVGIPVVGESLFYGWARRNNGVYKASSRKYSGLESLRQKKHPHELSVHASTVSAILDAHAGATACAGNDGSRAAEQRPTSRDKGERRAVEG